MKKENKNNHLVQQSNALIEASHKMSLVERRLMYYVLSKINPQKPQKDYELRVDDFVQDFPGMAHGGIYTQLKEGVQALYKRDIQLITDRGSTKIFRFLQEQEYKDKEGYLRMKFSDSTMPLIFDLKERFTTMILENFKHLNSVYALKLYELLYQYRNQGWRQVTVEDLRFFFGCVDTYPLFKRFNQMVIEPAIKEISEKTDILVQAEYIRTGRFITSIKFTFLDKSSSKDIIDVEFEKKKLKEPKRPSLKRHPNPKKYFDDETEKRDDFDIYNVEYIYARLHWALENYKRLTTYERQLKDYDSKSKLSQKDAELKADYLNVIADCYQKYHDNKKVIANFEQLKESILANLKVIGVEN